MLEAGVLHSHWVSQREQVPELETLPSLEGQQANSATRLFFHSVSLSALLSVPVLVEVHMYPE